MPAGGLLTIALSISWDGNVLGCRLSKRDSKRPFDLFRGVLETAVSRWVKMVRVSVLHDALKTMCNAEKRGKRQVLIRPASKVVTKFLQLMQKHGYIGDFEFVDDHRAGKMVVTLNGRMNKCGCISPRYDVGHEVRSRAMFCAGHKGVRWPAVQESSAPSTNSHLMYQFATIIEGAETYGV